MKKLILPILLLAAVLVVSGCIQPPQNGGDQKEVEVSVNLKSNSLEATSLQFDLHFNPQSIESAEAEPGLMTLSADKMFESNVEVEEGHLRVVIASLNNIKIGDGEIAKVKFKLKAGATEDSLDLEIDEVEVVNKDAEELEHREQKTSPNVFVISLVPQDPIVQDPCLVAECDPDEVCRDGKCIPLTEPTEHTINMLSTGFSPNSLTVKTGDTVTFVSKEGTHRPASDIHPTHAVYPESGGCIGSKFDACEGLSEGESWSFVFNEKGTWKYHDHLNSGLTGTIVVE